MDECQSRPALRSVDPLRSALVTDPGDPRAEVLNVPRQVHQRGTDRRQIGLGGCSRAGDTLEQGSDRSVGSSEPISHT